MNDAWNEVFYHFLTDYAYRDLDFFDLFLLVVLAHQVLRRPLVIYFVYLRLDL